MTLFQYHLVGLALTSISMLGLGLFVLWKNPKRNLHRSMAAYCWSIAWWSGWECTALQMPTKELTRQLLRVEYVGVVFITTLLCTTVSYLLDFSPRARRRFLLPLYAGSVIFLFFASIFPTKQFLDITPGPMFYLPFWAVAGPHYWPFLVFFLGTLIVAHAVILHRWYRAEGRERASLALFLIGSLLAYSGGCPEFALKYGVRLGWLNPFGLYLFPLYSVLVIYAVVQFKLFDINIIVRKSLVYSLLVTSLTAGYFGLIYAIERAFQISFGYHSLGLSLIAFGLMALLFQPLKIGIQRLVDWIIFRVPQEQIAKRMERLEEHALQAEKLKAISTLAAGMAHEIKNPLTAIKTFAEFIPEKQNDPIFMKRLHHVLTSETQRIQEVVQELLEFAKPKTPNLKPVDLGPIIKSTVDFLSGDLLKHSIQWAISCQHNNAVVQADADQLRQILINLIQNAADAMPTGGTLTLTTQANDGYLELAVTDTGEGIPKELLPKIFDPFVTTKPNGTGLGLAMVQTLVRTHRGAISVISTPARGTTFTLRFPL